DLLGSVDRGLRTSRSRPLFDDSKAAEGGFELRAASHEEATRRGPRLYHLELRVRTRKTLPLALITVTTDGARVVRAANAALLLGDAVAIPRTSAGVALLARLGSSFRRGRLGRARLRRGRRAGGRARRSCERRAFAGLRSGRRWSAAPA